MGCSLPASEIVVSVKVMIAAITGKSPNLKYLNSQLFVFHLHKVQAGAPYQGRASGGIGIKALFHSCSHTEGGFQSPPPWIPTSSQ